jgi:hypothetical protein
MTAFLASCRFRATDSGRMAMISGGDESARNAFRAYLRDDSSQLSLVSTEEMSPGDVLEVKNLADAIERAERVMRESSRPRDMFAELGGEGGQVPTDDASGPAVYAKPTFTPVPPPAATTPTPAPITTLRLPIIMVPNEEDAFLQPAGRMRHFAEETLDGYRPESTMQIRAGARRKTATMIAGAFFAVLALALGAGVVISCLPAKFEAKPTVVTATASPAKPADAPKTETATPTVKTLNVNDLPSAR